MDYGKYKNARNASWQCLIDFRVSKLPVKVSLIASSAGIPFVPFSRSEDVLKSLALENLLKNDGFTIYHNEMGYLIFYNDANSPQRIRFTIAHELGHIFLGHPFQPAENCLFTSINREAEPNDDPLEIEANIFSRDLLAPACVLWGYISTPRRKS